MQIADNLQRVGFLVMLPELLRSLGADPNRVLRAAGLGTTALDNPEATIPYAAMGRLLHLAVTETGCPHLGLLLGQRIGTASLGVVGELMSNAPTLGVALRDLAIHQHRHSRGSLVYLLTQGDHALFGYAVYQPGVEAHAQICDGAAAAALNIVRELMQSDGLDGLEVLISRSTPTSLDAYRRFFGVKVHFNADQTGALLPRSWLDRPVPGADASKRATLMERVEAYSRTGDLDLLAQLRRAVRVGLVTGQISGNDIALQLRVARRTLHRRLAMRGVSFQDVLDQTRFELAQQLLGNTYLGVSDIGLILRYADPSVFTRAFIRWAEVTPTEWRWNVMHGKAPSKDAALSELASESA